MRKVIKLIPAELVLPERYKINLHLDGGLSTLSIYEYYGKDVPLDVIEQTLSIVQKVIDANDIPVKVSKLSEHELLIEVTGDEFVVVRSLMGEMDLLRELIKTSPKIPVLPGRIGEARGSSDYK